MELNEKIKTTENMIKFSQDYLGVIKLLKVTKTGLATSNLKEVAEQLEQKIKECVEVIECKLQ